MRLFQKIRAFKSLGVRNVFRVARYRLELKTGLSKVRRLAATVPTGPFFSAPAGPGAGLPAVDGWTNHATYFGHYHVPLESAPPNWFLNPLTQHSAEHTDQPWWMFSDFDPAIGDIKAIWEPSRFDWLLAFAQRGAVGDKNALKQLETWLESWARGNPPYCGPNWKCGQEASIRVIHLAVAGIILGNISEASQGLRQLLEIHLSRISPTIGYAIGQDNNHGTSEAAALFIGGTWLELLGSAEGARWAASGVKLLEDRVGRLIEPDGSFSQYSLNYHRLALDTLSIVEVWRQRLSKPAFSGRFYQRASSAVEWLYSIIDLKSGDGPNLGANDGARLIPLTKTDYRDFRPSLQLACALFKKQRAIAADGHWNRQLDWLRVPLPDVAALQQVSRLFDNGGYAVLRRAGAMALLRYPRFRFRPSHADALHVDLWVGGRNILRDGGTFSYNSDAATLDLFAGTAGHNTIQFDGRDQMPRLGRFLFGEWLRARQVLFQEGTNEAGAGYVDFLGVSHHRHIVLREQSLVAKDTIAGPFSRAVLRWRLPPGNWIFDGEAVSDGTCRLKVTGNIELIRSELTVGAESLYYLERHDIPVFEVEVSGPGSLTSEISW